MRKTRRKICVVTGSRSEYGLLRCLMEEIKKDRYLALQVIATGMHLEKKFGLTCREILRDNFRIDAKVPMNLLSDTDEGIAKAMGSGVIGFAAAYKRLKPDIVVVLGDRFEIFAAASAALLSRIPIAHIHGGEITEGAYDNAMRHAITKIANLHFVAHDSYAETVIRMGEDPRAVFNFGAPGLDNIKRLKLLSKSKLEGDLGFEVDKDTALVTFHPVTMEKGKTGYYVANLVKALEKSGLKVIFTMPNADPENKHIFCGIEKYVNTYPHKAKAFKSLGQLRYLSLMKYVGLMIGNSSSGIIEAPSFRLAVVNIGNRQKGRVRAANVIDAKEDADSILRAIKIARSGQFRNILGRVGNPFGSGTASRKIKDVLKRIDIEDIKKK